MKSIYQYINEINVPEISDSDLPKGVVDLGLSVKWASCNIGADKPYEYGKLFQWGRVDGYAYGDTNNKFRTKEQNKADTGNEAIPVTTSSKTYSKGEILDKEDDAAYVATNGKLRMPTFDEISELITETTSQWCKCHFVLGRLFTSKKDESNKIFIPTAGYFDNDDFYSKGYNGVVWSSSVNSEHANSAYCIDFYLSYFNYYAYSRCNGFSVRGVCK